MAGIFEGVHPRLLLALACASAVALAAIVVATASRNPEGSVRQAAPDAAAITAGRPSPFAGSPLPDGVRAPDFSRRDQDGAPVRMREFRGRPVIVTFVYTRCEESCPAQVQQIKGALNELGHDVPALAIAVDPPRDTQASARHFLAEQGMAGRMDLVLGSRAELRPVWRGFAIQPQSARTEHQARITLVDPRGYQRVSFPLAQATPDRIAHDVRLLEAERQ